MHETAQVPTPEADVNLPPPPGQNTQTWQTEAQQAEVSQEGWRQRHPLATGCLAIVGLLFLIVVAAGALGGGGDDTAGGGGGNVAETPVEEEQARPEEPEGGGGGNGDRQEEQANQDQGPASIGEEVNVGDVSYTVTSAEPVSRLKDPYGLDQPLTGNFILVTFTFANKGDEPVTVSDLGLYLYDNQGREFETDTDAAFYLPEDKSLFMLDRVNPGLSQEIQTVYSVPPDAGGFELEVTSGFFASETARIDLGF